jgi:hypothetical protein
LQAVDAPFFFVVSVLTYTSCDIDPEEAEHALEIAEADLNRI